MGEIGWLVKSRLGARIKKTGKLLLQKTKTSDLDLRAWFVACRSRVRISGQCAGTLPATGDLTTCRENVVLDVVVVVNQRHAYCTVGKTVTSRSVL